MLITKNILLLLNYYTLKSTAFWSWRLLFVSFLACLVWPPILVFYISGAYHVQLSPFSSFISANQILFSFLASICAMFLFTALVLRYCVNRGKKLLSTFIVTAISIAFASSFYYCWPEFATSVLICVKISISFWAECAPWYYPEYFTAVLVDIPRVVKVTKILSASEAQAIVKACFYGTNSPFQRVSMLLAEDQSFTFLKRLLKAEPQGLPLPDSLHLLSSKYSAVLPYIQQKAQSLLQNWEHEALQQLMQQNTQKLNQILKEGPQQLLVFLDWLVQAEVGGNQSCHYFLDTVATSPFQPLEAWERYFSAYPTKLTPIINVEAYLQQKAKQTFMLLVYDLFLATTSLVAKRVWACLAG